MKQTAVLLVLLIAGFSTSAQLKVKPDCGVLTVDVYKGWINEAKQPETRRRRVERACENLVAGKRRPCCYAVVPMDLYRALGEDPTAKARWGDLTANEKRDYSDWVEAAPNRETRKGRVAEACALLSAGKRGP